MRVHVAVATRWWSRCRHPASHWETREVSDVDFLANAAAGVVVVAVIGMELVVDVDVAWAERW